MPKEGARGPLSAREAHVVELIAMGLTNRRIGEILSLSEHTVARHVANARAKLGAANRAEAVARFVQLGIGSRRRRTRG